MIPEHLPEHSPLGGSGMARAIACAYSPQLSAGLADDESEFAALGTAAHTLAEISMRAGDDAWKRIGYEVIAGSIAPAKGFVDPDEIAEPILVDKDMADAVQVWLDTIRATHPDRNQGNSWIEREFYCPTIHKYFWGKADFVFLDEDQQHLHVWDYKHGAGIMVFPENNVQCKYYACGVLEDLGMWGDVTDVTVHIVQPRGYLEPHRSWSIETWALEEWLEQDLVPAMDYATYDAGPSDLDSGEHCRFCPARNYACPKLLEDMEEYEEMVADLLELNQEEAEARIREWSPEEIGRFLFLRDLSKSVVGKAADKVGFQRLQSGVAIPGYKLGPARANREWKEDAEPAIKKKYGVKRAYETKLLSPAKIEKLPGGKAMTERYAYKPDAGLTILPDSDPRPAIDRNTKSMFAPVKGKGRKKK